MIKHGHYRDRKMSPEYRAWCNMLYRCRNKNCRKYEIYGGRGITVCKAWHSFPAFLAYVQEHLGSRPSLKHSLDRIKNDQGYRPGNIRWATPIEQRRNRRNKLTPVNVRAIRRDKRMQKIIAQEYGISAVHVSRIKSGGAWAWL